MHYFTCLYIFKEEASDIAMLNEDQATGTLEEDQTAETESDKRQVGLNGDNAKNVQKYVVEMQYSAI